MRTESYRPKSAHLISLLVIYSFIAGCGEQARTTPTSPEELGTTIGSLVEVFAPESIPVEGYGLAGGLRGTGSGECPPDIRAYLKQYILTQLPERGMNVDEFINSRNTAVVRVYGIMPAAVTAHQYFDVRLEALRGTQTTSLEGGWLYGADLKGLGTFGIATRVLATAKGPVFTHTLDASGTEKRVGYVLAGGRVHDRYRITLALRKPDFVAARRISDLLDTRFVTGTAKAVSPEVIELRVPAEYGEQKQRFISLVKAIYLAETPQVTEKRIETLIEELARGANKEASEAALEAIGRKCLGRLAPLLNLPDEEVRLRAARCGLNLGSNQGLETLRQIAMDRGSAYRIEALEAITAGANRRYAAAVSQRLLRDDDFQIRLAAYEQLRKLDDVAIKQTLVGGNFYLEQIAGARHRAVFVSRSGQPRIVLFGVPIYCRENIFVQSANGEIIIDAKGGQKYVSVMRKVPERPDLAPIRLRSSFELSDIIRTLCEEPVAGEGSPRRPGLNVSYSKAIAILKQMCEQGAVDATFRAGPLPKID